MQYLPWIVAGVLAIVALLQFTAAKSACLKLNTLNEYVQFLLFQPEVYNDHRDKFLGFVAQQSSAAVADQAMASYQAIENMAAQLFDDALLANIKMRSQSQESTSDR